MFFNKDVHDSNTIWGHWTLVSYASDAWNTIDRSIIRSITYANKFKNTLYKIDFYIVYSLVYIVYIAVLHCILILDLACFILAVVILSFIIFLICS